MDTNNKYIFPNKGLAEAFVKALRSFDIFCKSSAGCPSKFIIDLVAPAFPETATDTRWAVTARSSKGLIERADAFARGMVYAASM